MRLVDADALKQADFQDFSNTDVLCAIDEAPTIDAMPVVRCVECKHYNTTGCSVGFGWCESMDRGVSDEFFCACAEKLAYINDRLDGVQFTQEELEERTEYDQNTHNR